MAVDGLGFEDDEDELGFETDEDEELAQLERRSAFDESEQVQDERPEETEPESSTFGAHVFNDAPNQSFEDWLSETESAPAKSWTEEGSTTGRVPTDAYREEVSKLLDDEAFWGQSYEQQVTDLRKLYLGDELKGTREFEDDDEIVGLHKELLSTVREYNGAPIVEPQDYADMIAPWPEEELKEAKGSRDVAAVLDKWEATSLSAGKANGGIYWRENEELISGQIADIVDGIKRRTVAEKNLPAETGIGGQFLGNFSTVAKAFLSTGARIIPGEIGDKAVRAIETTSLLPESESVLKGEVVLNVPGIGEVPSVDVLSGMGSGAAFVVGGGTAAALKVPRVLAAGAIMSAGARLGYAEAYEAVFEKTGSAERANMAGWSNAPVEAVDSLFDAAVGAGLISPLKKGVSTAVKRTALSRLSAEGFLGEGVKNGFRIAGNTAIAAAVEGGTEVAQEFATGQIEAHFANDPTLKRTPQQLAAAGIGGAIVGSGGQVAAESAGLTDGANAIKEAQALAPEELETPAAEEQVLPQEETKSPAGETIPAPSDMEQAQAAASPGTLEDVVSPETGKYRSLDDRVFTGERRLVPLEELTVQQDVKQFKKGADPETGVTGDPKDLGDEFYKAQAGEIAVLQKDVTGNGELEVISGRNRFAIAQADESVSEIPAYVYKESDGFTIDDAKTMDAELNIRDNAGETIDYAKFFERAQIPRDKARARGYLRNVKGLRGYNIGTHASPEVKASYYSDKIGEKEAAGIAAAAPSNPELQRAGLDEVLKGTPVETAVNTMRVLERAKGLSSTAGQTMDMFGNSAVMSDARVLGGAATSIQKELRDAKTTLESSRRLSKKNLANLPGISADLKVNDPKAVKAETDRLSGEITRWDNWSLHPDLVQQVEERAAAELKDQGAQLGLSLKEPAASASTSQPAKSRAQTTPAREESPSESVEPAENRPAAMKAPPEKKTKKSAKAPAEESPTAGQPKLVGTSAVAEEQFATSELFEKLQATRDEAIESGAPEASPVSEPAFDELVNQEAGQYLMTGHREQEFLADRFLGDKDIETVARDMVDPEKDVFGVLPMVTQQVIRAKVIKAIEQRERAARAAGETERAADLKLLTTALYVENIQNRSGAGQVLGIGVLTNRILGIAPADQVLTMVEDIININRDSIEPRVQLEMVELTNEADAIAEEENKIGNFAAEVRAKEAEMKLLRDKIEKKRAELEAKKEKLRQAKLELEKEKRRLQAAGRRVDKQDAKALVRQSELEKQIAELENLIEWNQNHLKLNQERFERVQAELKSDVKSLQGIQRQIDKRRKQFIKKEKELRQRRAKTREKLVFKTLPASVQGELKRLAEQLEAAPQGSFVRQEIAGKMIELAVMAGGGLTPLEVARAIWYTNALAGLSTQGINVYGNALSLNFRSLGFALREPKIFVPYLQGLVSGMEKGAVEVLSIVREGRSGRFVSDSKLSDNAVRSTLEMLQPESTLEALLTLDSEVGAIERLKKAGVIIKGNPLVEVLTGFGIGKFMGRMLRAGDAFFYRTSYDGMTAALIAKHARKEGLTQKEIALRVSDALYLSSTRAKEAMTRAEESLKESLGEGEFSERDVTRVAMEFMDQQLPVPVRDEANRWGSLNTFTNEPQGVFGEIARILNNAMSNPAFNIATRWGNFPVLHPFFPFINIVANVADTGLEFSPVGFLRAARTKDQALRVERATNAVIGSALGSVMFGLAYANWDEDDPPFAIYGSGNPLTKERKDQMKQSGWRPFTVKIGDTYVPYKETPLYWLAAFGSYFDNMRWNSKFEEKSGEKKLWMMFAGVAGVFGDQAALQGLSNIVSALTGDIGKVEALKNSASSYLGVYLPGGAFARDLDRIFNADFEEVVPPAGDDQLLSVKTIKSAAGNFLGSMFRNYPVAGDMINRPLLNGFGEEIKPTFGERFGLIRRTIGTAREDDLTPEWRFLAERGLNFNGFKRNITITAGRKGENAGVIRKREQILGRIYAEVLTPDERYRFVQFAGPLIKKEVTKVMTTAGKKPRQVLQAEIDKAVTKVKKDAKNRFVHREINQIR